MEHPRLQPSQHKHGRDFKESRHIYIYSNTYDLELTTVLYKIATLQLELPTTNKVQRLFGLLG